MELATTINLNHIDRITFAPDIFERLPEIMFKEGCNVLTSENEKSVFLFGALGTLSGLLPNIIGTYDGKEVTPNLYTYLLGNYGSGKGVLSYCKTLSDKIHKDKINSTVEAKQNHEIELQQHKNDFSDWKKNPIGEPPQPPPEPTQSLLFIPANNSKSGFIELLNNNCGAGILFESEGDTLTDAIRQDYGAYSDALRKAFHHETISFYRRNDTEFVEIDNPRLSVVISSTFDQLLSLIPNAENGLFSRFCYYTIESDPAFKDVFNADRNGYQNAFRDKSQTLKKYYDYLAGFKTPAIFEFTKNQISEFMKFFSVMKEEIRNDITEDLDGTINRLGLQYFRIAMILTTFRTFENNAVSEGKTFNCSDDDFQVTKDIINVLKNNAIDVYLKLPKPEIKHKAIDRADDIKRAIEMHNSGLSYQAIADQLNMNKSTVWRWINKN